MDILSRNTIDLHSVKVFINCERYDPEKGGEIQSDGAATSLKIQRKLPSLSR